MPKRFIRRYLPDHLKMRDHPHLQRFGARLHDGNLWHLNRRSVSGAVAIGLFCALLPLPFQMLIAAGFAIWWRVNLPISVTLVWITNPFTMPPVWYATYRLGAWMLGLPPRNVNFELSLEYLLVGMHDVWKPLLLGSLVTGVVLAAVGFALVRLLWRGYVVRHRRATVQRIKDRLSAGTDRTGS